MDIGSAAGNVTNKLLWWCIVAAWPHLRDAPGPIEETAIFLKGELGPDDIVLVSSPTDAPLLYYFDRHGIPRTFIDRVGKSRLRGISFDRAFIVYNHSFQPTLEVAAVEAGLAPEKLNLAGAREITAFGATIIAVCPSAV